MCACVPRGDVSMALRRFQEDAFSWVLFCRKISLWWFWVSLSYELGESARRPLSLDFLCGHHLYSIQTTDKTTGS